MGAWCDGEVHVPSFWATGTAYDLLFFRAQGSRASASLPQRPQPLELPRNTNRHQVYTQISRMGVVSRGCGIASGSGRCGRDNRADREVCGWGGS